MAFGDTVNPSNLPSYSPGGGHHGPTARNFTFAAADGTVYRILADEEGFGLQRMEGGRFSYVRGSSSAVVNEDGIFTDPEAIANLTELFSSAMIYPRSFDVAGNDSEMNRVLRASLEGQSVVVNTTLLEMNASVESQRQAAADQAFRATLPPPAPSATPRKATIVDGQGSSLISGSSEFSATVVLTDGTRVDMVPNSSNADFRLTITNSDTGPTGRSLPTLENDGANNALRDVFRQIAGGDDVLNAREMTALRAIANTMVDLGRDGSFNASDNQNIARVAREQLAELQR